ncbi:predicted protein [Streptomyces viridosporus ATCC 14672]|uniref:Predicted protein n=1 Tax=Streptomyces viridosporus (strain ATCC 14672 / DSM 40746 / JCM 4963 / KCTC 9882 / NRRL B-12104 / FH 1290) TaxID=566461 RepID=D5ZSP8_STRV1|nr:predicted protein [Streptomyces viridosporus ATCC 14672]
MPAWRTAATPILFAVALPLAVFYVLRSQGASQWLALRLRQLEVAGHRAGVTRTRGTHSGRGRQSAEKIVRQERGV